MSHPPWSAKSVKNLARSLRQTRFLDSHAPWCPACKALSSTWQGVASWSDDLGISVAEIDVTENPGTAPVGLKIHRGDTSFTQGVSPIRFPSARRMNGTIQKRNNIHNVSSELRCSLFFRAEREIFGHVSAHNLSVSHVFPSAVASPTEIILTQLSCEVDFCFVLTQCEGRRV